MKKTQVFLLFLFCVTSFAHGETIFGYAHVTDGNTIIVNGEKVRMLCVDTPESYYYGHIQYCLDNETNCGRMAKRQLKRLINSRLVSCELYGYDVYN